MDIRAGPANENSRRGGGHTKGKRQWVTRLSALFLAFALVASLAPPAHAACAHTWRNYCDAEHPHAKYKMCTKCYAVQYTGGTQYKSNCSICNPPVEKCKHTGATYTDSAHPHAVYCRQCSQKIQSSSASYSGATCTAAGKCDICGVSGGSALGHNWNTYCEAAHPHKEYKECSRCYTQSYTGNNCTKDNCVQCHPELAACKHDGAQWTDPTHPHPVYCRLCSKVLHETSYLSTCAKCVVGDDVNIPVGLTQVNLYVEALQIPLDSLDNESGVLSAEIFPAKYRVTAEVTGGGTLLSVSGSAGTALNWFGSNGGVITVEKGDRLPQTWTLTAKSKEGASRTITCTIKLQNSTSADTRWRTTGLQLRSAKDDAGSTVRSGLNLFAELNNANTLTDAAQESIVDAVGRYDGKTYTLSGGMVVEVYSYSTGKVYGKYVMDTSDYDRLCAGYAWTAASLSSFVTMQKATVSYQAPLLVNARAVYKRDVGTVIGSITAGQVNPEWVYIFPHQTLTISFNKDMLDPPAGYAYHGMEWAYTPPDGAHTYGSSSTLTARSEVYNYTSPAIQYIFWYKAISGSVTVRVLNKSGVTIDNASIKLNGSTVSNGETTTGLAFGSYTATANAPGYVAGSGSTTITGDFPHSTITIKLDEYIPEPTSGSVTVKVVDKTGAPLSGAAVSGIGTAKTTGADGTVSYSGLSFGSYTATAAKAGLGTGSGSASISKTNPDNTITITLANYDLTVTVKDSQTNAVIPGATVSGVGSGTKTTGAAGNVVFAGLTSGSYTVTATATGYSAKSVDVSLTGDKSVVILLDPAKATLQSIVPELSYHSKAKGYLRSGYGFELKATVTVVFNYDPSDYGQTLKATTRNSLTNYATTTTALEQLSNTITKNADGTWTEVTVWQLPKNKTSPDKLRKLYIPVAWKGSTEGGSDYMIDLKLAQEIVGGDGWLIQTLLGKNTPALRINVVGSMYDDDYIHVN